MISETGTRRSAILLMALGEDRAAAALAHLATNEVQTLGLAMAKLASVSKNELNTVLSEFRHETEQLSALHLGSSSYIRAVLRKALGEDRASNLLEDILQNDEPHSGIERLNQREASFGGVQPSALMELTDVLTEMLSGQGLKRSRLGGVRTAAEIVNLMNSTQEEEAIAHVREHDEALAQRIIDEMFVFENLLSLEDRSIQRLLKDIESDSLIIALKGAPQELRDKFLANMSQRAAETLREDMELRGPVRVSQVEAEQKAILQVVRRLADAGEVVIAAPGTDD